MNPRSSLQRGFIEIFEWLRENEREKKYHFNLEIWGPKKSRATVPLSQESECKSRLLVILETVVTRVTLQSNLHLNGPLIVVTRPFFSNALVEDRLEKKISLTHSHFSRPPHPYRLAGLLKCRLNQDHGASIRV